MAFFASIHVHRVVNNYDRNNNGVIDIKAGSKDKVGMAADAFRYFQKADRNHDGRVGARELRRMHAAQ